MSALTAHLRQGKQAVEAMEPFTVLSPLVTRIAGANPGPYTLGGTNTYLIGNGAKRLLFDTGEGRPQFLDNLESAMSAVGCTEIEAVIISHWHHDHLGGVPGVQELLARRGQAAVPVHKVMPSALEPAFRGEGARSPYEVWPEDRFVPLKDEQVVATEGATLRIMHTPGHANDHVVAVLEEERAMFSADNVLGTGTGVFRDLTEYLASLRRMLDTQVGRLYPAHGPVIEDGKTRISEYIEHRMQRVRQVEVALKAGAQLTPEEVTRAVYPADLPPELFAPATSNTLQVLRYLEQQGLAQCDASGGRWMVREAESSL